MVGQYDLQVAHGRFFKIITAGIAIKPCTAFRGHANDMAGFVKE
jgi:hypothetical protein